MKLPKELDKKLSRIVPNTFKPSRSDAKGKNVTHRNENGVCPICNRKLKSDIYKCNDGSSPYLRLYLKNSKMDGIYYCHLECFFILYTCMRETINHYDSEYAVFDL